MKIKIIPTFKLFQFVFGIAGQRSGIVNGLTDPPRERRDYLLAICVWPFQVTLCLSVGCMDPFPAQGTMA